MGIRDWWNSAKEWVGEIGETPLPKGEPELADYAKYIKRKGKKYLFPVKWDENGKPKKYKEMTKRSLNKILVKLNMRFLNRKIALYNGVIVHYQSKIDRLKLSLSTATRKGAADTESRSALQKRVKLMWENYESKYRSTSSRKSHEAREYREKILALQRTIPRKSDIEEYHQGRVDRHQFSLKEIEDVASARARGRNTVIRPTATNWKGDLKDLVAVYEKDIDVVKKNLLSPAKDRLGQNKDWLYNKK